MRSWAQCSDAGAQSWCAVPTERARLALTDASRLGMPGEPGHLGWLFVISVTSLSTAYCIFGARPAQSAVLNPFTHLVATRSTIQHYAAA